MKFKPGDMVVLIDIRIDSSGYEAGFRVGCVGEVVAVYPVCNDYLVMFPPAKMFCAEHHLRLVPPPEACDEDFDWRDLKAPEEIA